MGCVQICATQMGNAMRTIYAHAFQGTLVLSVISVSQFYFTYEVVSHRLKSNVCIIAGTCDFGVSWADKAYAIDAGHQLAECSHAGLCNRDTGVCDCYKGYTGQACEKGSSKFS